MIVHSQIQDCRKTTVKNVRLLFYFTVRRSLLTTYTASLHLYNTVLLLVRCTHQTLPSTKAAYKVLGLQTKGVGNKHSPQTKATVIVQGLLLQGGSLKNLKNIWKLEELDMTVTRLFKSKLHHFFCVQWRLLSTTCQNCPQKTLITILDQEEKQKQKGFVTKRSFHLCNVS